MHFKLLNPSKYLQATDFEAPDWKLGREPTLTIRQVVLEVMEGEKKDEKKVKGMILLAEVPKGWVMNVTNAKCMAAMWGDETNAWVGKRITLMSEKVYAFGEWVPGIRIKGSPDLAEAKSVTIKLRKKTEVVNLVKTGTAPAANGNGHTNGKTARPPFIPDATVKIGPRKGTQIVQLTHDELTAAITASKDAAAKAKPGVAWLPDVLAHQAELEADQQRRSQLEQAIDAGPPPGATEDAPPF